MAGGYSKHYPESVRQALSVAFVGCRSLDNPRSFVLPRSLNRTHAGKHVRNNWGQSKINWMSAMYMDPSCLTSSFSTRVRRECIFGFLAETLSPNPQCMRTPFPI